MSPICGTVSQIDILVLRLLIAKTSEILSLRLASQKIIHTATKL